ncbi:aminotransferase class V-fold PLP-dependent enzyme [Clostridium chromiireducens]|uniref:Aminotransferase class V-fold PLP-dependent enzyme n=2 Tax=Clostridium chromiireducens TaxID=225345 RepID=A0A399IGB8_9CLOT|nr:aminotransferase class V-fold PLP-dependent enzyme [Clostridium chromiireducens]
MNLKDIVVGSDTRAPISGGSTLRYINFDNAATTPPFKKVMEKINEFSEFYSSVHRGSGFKSNLSTEVYEQCKEIVMDFVGADKEVNIAIFLKNATEALNKVANMFNLCEGDIIICSRMEHHSNDLPWRRKAEVHYIDIDENGELNLNHFEMLLKLYGKRVKLVTVTGASNVTGYINPIHEIAKLAHSVGAKLLIDASQLVAHRKLDVKDDNNESHLDFIVFSGHKLYAPFGTAVVIGPKEFFNTAEPDTVGGGMVKIVTDDLVYWEESPTKNEAGTPNLMGAVALATAIKQINDIGMVNIEAHEYFLTKHLLHHIKKIDKIRIYGSTEADKEKRLGVVAFNIDGISHGLVAAILSYEYGIAVRNGCFCSHPYVFRLLNLSSEEIQSHRLSILDNDKSKVPGLVRVSLGLYNTLEDMNELVLALNNISEGKIMEKYTINKEQGVYIPENGYFGFSSPFKL